MTEYFGHRLNLAPGEVTLSTILSHFPEEAERLEPLYTAVEQHRYGLDQAGGEDMDLNVLLNRFTAALRNCERKRI